MIKLKGCFSLFFHIIFRHCCEMIKLKGCFSQFFNNIFRHCCEMIKLLIHKVPYFQSTRVPKVPSKHNPGNSVPPSQL